VLDLMPSATLANLILRSSSDPLDASAFFHRDPIACAQVKVPTF